MGSVNIYLVMMCIETLVLPFLFKILDVNMLAFTALLVLRESRIITIDHQWSRNRVNYFEPCEIK